MMLYFRKTGPRVASQLKRDLDAKSRSESYRCLFRLPSNERLESEVTCSLWTPYNRAHVSGKLYLSKHFLCFASKVRHGLPQALPVHSWSKVAHQVNLIIPFRDISSIEKASENSSFDDHDYQSTLIITRKDAVREQRLKTRSSMTPIDSSRVRS